MTSTDLPVVVVGAGIVGTATAAFLQRQGEKVILIDRNAPGSGCSSGNAGMLGTNSCVPSSLPGVIRKVPGMMRGPDGALGLRIRDILALSPWLWRFVRSGRPSRVAEIADALHQLQRQIIPAYHALLGREPSQRLIRTSGKLHTYESENTWADSQYGLSLQEQRSIPFQRLSGDEARELMPALGASIVRAIHFPDISYSVDPRKMVEEVAGDFAAHGGQIVSDDVQSIETDGSSGHAICSNRRFAFSRLVIAAGFWSRDLAARIGAKVPLEVQRGYHVMMSTPPGGDTMPIKSEDRKIIVTPMAQGSRVTGVAEFAAPDAPPSAGRHAALVDHARAVMPGFSSDYSDPWIGSRPCTPDSLPVLDRAPRHPNVFLAFGHGHLGLGLGAISGRLMAELVISGRTSIDLAPYRCIRF